MRTFRVLLVCSRFALACSRSRAPAPRRSTIRPSRSTSSSASRPAARTTSPARLFGQYLSEHLGQQFIIENRVGAGGNIGTQAYLAAPPDGYTIGFVGPNNFISASLYAKLPFDFIRDSMPVGGTMKMTNVLEVNPDVPIKTVAEYIAYAKANPGQDQLRLTAASAPRRTCRANCSSR